MHVMHNVDVVCAKINLSHKVCVLRTNPLVRNNTARSTQKHRTKMQRLSLTLAVSATNSISTPPITAADALAYSPRKPPSREWLQNSLSNEHRRHEHPRTPFRGINKITLCVDCQEVRIGEMLATSSSCKKCEDTLTENTTGIFLCDVQGITGTARRWQFNNAARH